MQQVIVHEGPRAELVEAPIPIPAADEVVVRVVVAGSNPKDWKTWWVPQPINQGNDMAGFVHAVGSQVTGFRPGDRVVAFHDVAAPHGTHADYAIARAVVTAHLPPAVSFEDAATVPLAAMTSALALYRGLGMPQPWAPADSPLPLLIYGGGSAVGAFAIKLARLSNIHPIIAVAGRSTPWVASLLDKDRGDAVIDNRQGADVVLQGVRDAVAAAGAGGIRHAFDAISEGDSIKHTAAVVQPGASIATTLPVEAPDLSPPPTLTVVGDIHGAMGERPGARDFGCVFMQAFARWLADGRLQPHPYKVCPGGLKGIQTALDGLKEGKASGFKYVFRLQDGASEH
ncbi:quinone oxidoreductase [Lasiodiplodia theobromae]|nr:quinone oxidoreductase [Lasiodiplodia theobromae]